VGSDVNNFDFIPVGAQGFLETPASQPSAITYPGSLSTESIGFSDAFQIVGYYADQTDVLHGFSYNFSSYTTIDAPGYSTTGWRSVNTPGDMVGTVSDATGMIHAILRSGGIFTQVDYHPSRTNHFNQANHINDFGQIVGETPGGVGQPATIGFLRLPAARNAVPFINHPLVPNTAVPGSAGFTLTVEGTGFVSGAVVNWNGNHRSTSFENSGKLTATISASDVAAAGTALVTVVNPGPGGGSSNVRFFQVTGPTPTPAFNRSTLTAGSSPQRNIAADFNRDGTMDLAVADGANNKVLVLLGNGNGAFQSPVSYQVGKNPSTLIAADFDNDGKLDIAVGDSDGGIYVLQGNGDGTFHVDSIISVAGAGPWDLAVGDFNGDGRLDLACVNQTDSTISIFLGNGDATFHGDGFFQPAAVVPTNASPAQITVGDFNGDGFLDMAVANFGGFSGDTVSVFLGNGNGTFKPKVDYDVSLAPLSIVAADFNGDGKLDLAVANSCGSSSPCGRPGSVSILLGNGDGTFEHHMDYPVGWFPYTIVAGDFNGDGNLDVAVSDLDSLQVTILSGVGDGTFQSSTVLSTSASPVGLLAADFNRDGEMDLAVGTGSGVDIMLQHSSTTITLSPTTLSFGNEAIGTTSVSKTVTVTNTGTALLTIGSIAASVDFAVSSTTCGATLAAQAKCMVSVAFTPPALGPFTGTLTFVDSGAASPQTVSLKGTGVAQVSWTPTSLTFTNRAVETTSVARVVTLTNNLPTALSVSGISFTGTDPGDFAQTSTCGNSVAAKGKCTISVTFTPQATGSRTATLNVSDGASNSPQTVSLKGTGEVQVKLAPTSLTFAMQTAGTTSVAKVVTLTNNLPTTLNISGVSFTGTNAGDFAQTNTCGGSVAAKGKCAISVTFTPHATGARTATLNVRDGANTSPQTASLKGTGK
jgi:FG-GAP-like repeat/Abnormal spindle-like microcephaly-assoc'd, ASPM-SPD-2-Hydin